MGVSRTPNLAKNLINSIRADASPWHFDVRPWEGFIRFLVRLPCSLLALLLLWQQRAIDRRHLERLSEHELQDIGLTRADLAPEIDKPFWQP